MDRPLPFPLAFSQKRGILNMYTLRRTLYHHGEGRNGHAVLPRAQTNERRSIKTSVSCGLKPMFRAVFCTLWEKGGSYEKR